MLKTPFSNRFSLFSVTQPKFRIRFFQLLLVVSTLTVLSGCASKLVGSTPIDDGNAPVAFNAELAYFETLAMNAQTVDVQVLALLLLEYQSNGQESAGVEFFTQLLEQRGDQLETPQKLVSMSSLGILRAGVASKVPLLGRKQWVQSTIDLLEEARSLGGNNVFFSRLATGLVYSQLPDSFNKMEQAKEDLDWLVAHSEKAPNPGVMRSVYNQRQVLGMDDLSKQLPGERTAAANVSSNFSVSPVHGATFYPKHFEVIVPGRVFLISGLEFTEYYFILSADKKQLISIDAGTRPDFAMAAYRTLKRYVPDAPLVSHVFVTHAHWDHVGGREFFKSINPSVRFYGRENYHEEIAIMEAGPGNEFGWFFGESFDFSVIKSYQPDVLISEKQTVDIGGTQFELMPAPGSETPDALFIHMPEEELLFVGDFIMPFSGAPFIEEGNMQELFAAVDLIDSINPKRLLHGHQPLSDFFSSPSDTNALKIHLTWLVDETSKLIRAGQTRGEIHRQNLIPDSILSETKSQQYYLVMREQVINRLYDQAVGYWESDLAGLDTLDAKSYGEMLSRYLKLDEDKTIALVDDMMRAADYHLAERVLRWARAEWPDSKPLADLQRNAALKLRIKYQSYNPFKFFLYSELADAPLGRPVPTE